MLLTHRESTRGIGGRCRRELAERSTMWRPPSRRSTAPGRSLPGRDRNSLQPPPPPPRWALSVGSGGASQPLVAVTSVRYVRAYTDGRAGGREGSHQTGSASGWRESHRPGWPRRLGDSTSAPPPDPPAGERASERASERCQSATRKRILLQNLSNSASTLHGGGKIRWRAQYSRVRDRLWS